MKDITVKFLILLLFLTAFLPYYVEAEEVNMITKHGGVYYFDDGAGEHKETYYNLSMRRIVSIAHERVNPNWFYWEREDGMKMFGPFIMVAANQKVHPYGSIVLTSRGVGIVVDTGGFAKNNPTQIDIAVTW